MVQVEPIKAFQDNYIWAIRDTKQNLVWVVDPGQASPVMNYLAQHSAKLQGILITHHHWDHTDGVSELQTFAPGIPIYGPKSSPFEGITQPLVEGDEVSVLGKQYSIIETPGHTLDHICYINDQHSFTGDTLFSAGCGRLFEGNPIQMWQSLQKLLSLSDHTQIYCTHEYTTANLAFAQAVEPDNQDIQDYQQWVNQRRNQELPTLPTTMAKERLVNPFLRADLEHICKHIPTQFTRNQSDPWQVFAALRAWKDAF
ncbi:MULTISPECIES: hydroxyacylglutathione hydrolase [Pseudoalteromonas]|uniref:Hydroxyacylglutathione hydrolase n=1 Tax=Pseudoalteromonas amylolytica TaxID=1859457 RepID=A0A1S1MLW7_9GAMM|nr:MULTISPECIES: hydroxyacylglutathione hydrolase [Pseudoalteromonas]OHU86714.1 hydroxyacylglutathione hydrolase [Pseudoalteromonas sp. JW3]OHU88762.1 hydroxyacylglutathione hydrolase [Pseudoalteromonas amylolytica]